MAYVELIATTKYLLKNMFSIDYSTKKAIMTLSYKVLL